MLSVIPEETFDKMKHVKLIFKQLSIIHKSFVF